MAYNKVDVNVDINEHFSLKISDSALSSSLKTNHSPHEVEDLILAIDARMGSVEFTQSLSVSLLSSLLPDAQSHLNAVELAEYKKNIQEISNLLGKIVEAENPTLL